MNPTPPGGGGPRVPWGSPPAAPPPAPTGGYGVDLPPGVRPDWGSPGDGGQQNEPTGVVSLVLGLLSVFFVFCCAVFTFLFSVSGVVTGIISLVRIHSEPIRFRGRGIAIAGIAVSLLGPLLYVLLWLFAGALTLMPAVFGP